MSNFNNDGYQYETETANNSQAIANDNSSDKKINPTTASNNGNSNLNQNSNPNTGANNEVNNPQNNADVEKSTFTNPQKEEPTKSPEPAPNSKFSDWQSRDEKGNQARLYWLAADKCYVLVQNGGQKFKYFYHHPSNEADITDAFAVPTNQEFQPKDAPTDIDLAYKFKAFAQLDAAQKSGKTKAESEENEDDPKSKVTWEKGIMSSFYIGGKKGEANLGTAQKDVWSLVPPKRRKARASNNFVNGDIIIEFEDVKLEEHPNLSLQKVKIYLVEPQKPEDLPNFQKQFKPGENTKDYQKQAANFLADGLFARECAGLSTGQKMPLERVGDSGIQLLFNLCASKEGYLYQVANVAQTVPVRVVDGEVKYPSKSAPTDKPQNLNQSGENGISNESTTRRNQDEKWQFNGRTNMRDTETHPPLANGETLPKQEFDGSPKRKKDKNGKELPVTSLFDGITTISAEVGWDENPNNQNEKNGKIDKSRNSMVFHELWENYERSTNLEPYQYTKFDDNGKAIHDGLTEYVEDKTKKGAHQKAVDAEADFWNKSLVPGAATYSININTGEIIKGKK